MGTTFSNSSLPLTPKAPRKDWGYQFQQYGVALAVTLPLFLVLSIYLFYRRGYYDLYIANKVLAGVATVVLGLVLLIGPLSRFFSFPDRFLQYRKGLGIVAFFLAFSHSVISLSPPLSKISLVGLLGTLEWPLIFGLMAILILLAIFCISNDRAMLALGTKRWWQMQYWGVRLTFALIILHVFIMKWGGWVKWYRIGGGGELVHPEWPGAGLLIGWFAFFVLLVRLAEFRNQKLGRVTWYGSVVALPIIYLVTFWWGTHLIR